VSFTLSSFRKEFKNLKINEKKPVRKYRVGLEKQIEISDCGSVGLESNEQVTFVTQDGKEYDVAAKSWGFYATPSVNGRLKAQGFKTALVRNSQGKIYVMLVDPTKMKDFEAYLAEEKQIVEEWLDER
jgi:hypothetical protein